MIDLKQDTLEKLREARARDLVDKEVDPLLDAINGIEDAVTTSSCSGRVQLIQVPDLGDKRGSNILGKWHRTVTSEEVLESYGKWDGEGQVHLLVQPLLVHIRCRNLITAVKLRNAAQEKGMKFSTIRSMKMGRRGNPLEWGIVVEFLGTERMEVPVYGIDREIIPDVIGPLIEHGNQLIIRTKSRIPVLTEAMERIAH